MRWSLRIFACCLLMAATAQAQRTTSPLPAFSLAPLSVTGSGLKAKQIERFNLALEDFKDTYHNFGVGKAELATLADSGDRLLATSDEAFSNSTQRSAFVSRYLQLASQIEEVVRSPEKFGVASNQELRLAKYLRVSAEVATLHGSPAGVVPVPPISGLPAETSGITFKSLEKAAPEALEKAQARLLDTRVRNSPAEFFCSKDARYAITMETIADKQARYALWTLDDSTLLRYLSAEMDKATPRNGEEDREAEKVDTTFPARSARRFIFSPDGKLIAGLFDPEPMRVDGVLHDEILIWELDSGTLVRKIRSAAHHHQTFFFIDDTHIVSKSFNAVGAGIERIDVTSGEIIFLMKPAGFEMYGGALHDGMLAFHIPNGMLTVNLEDKAQQRFLPPPPGTSRMAAERMWYGKDGANLFVRKAGTIEKWHPATRSFVQDWQLAPLGRMQDVLDVAEEANLVGIRRTDEQKIDFFNPDQGEVVSSLRLPFRNVNIAGISPSAKRVLIHNGEGQTLLLDFPNGLPSGEIDGGVLLKKAEGKLWR